MTGIRHERSAFDTSHDVGATHSSGAPNMIVRMGLLQRRSGMSPAAFGKHWRDVHGPSGARLPGLRRYHQNHIIDTEQRGIDYPRGPLTIEGISELWFDDEPSMQRAIKSDVMDALAADEANLIDDIHVVSAEQHVVIPTPSGMPLLKRMSTLKRRHDVSPQAFRHEWFEIHSILVKRLPQVKGYTQNLVLDRK